MLKSYNSTKPSLYISSTLIAISLLSGAILSSSSSSADVVDDVVVTVPISCNMASELDEAHTATINPGQYQSDIGTTNFTVFCNDNSGYAIYAIGYSNEEYGNTKMLATINNQLSPTNDISTGTAISGNTSAWAMKLVPVTTASSGTTQPYTPTIESDTNGPFSNYHIVPAEYTKVATFTSNTDFTIGSSLQSTYQVYIDGTKPAGTYAGKVKYTLVHPATAPAPVTCNPNGTTIGTNTGTDIKCMQDFASLSTTAKTTLLNTMTEGTQYTLIDKRDEKSYTIAKLADGKVWMTSNLDLDLDANTTYTNEDTDLGWNTSTNQYDTASWSPMRSTYATATNNIHEWCQGGTLSDGYCEQNHTPESYDPGNLYWNGVTSDYSDWNAYYNSCDYSTSTPSCDESLNPLSTYTSSTGTVQYHLGNYYNWTAAIASNDSSQYGAYNETTGEYENLETNQSICPAGWTLPYATYNNNTNQSEGDFVDLWTEYGWDSNNYNFSDIANLTGAPLYFAPAGGFNGNLGYVGYDGYFWSSVAVNDYDAHDACFYVDGNAGPADSDGRGSGNSVRCLLR